MILFDVYKRYPFPISKRMKFFNVFRYAFIFSPFESFLIDKLSSNHYSWWRKCIPPIYFYKEGSMRNVVRMGISFELDISKYLDHFIFFYCRDIAWENLFGVVKKDFHCIDAGANIGIVSLNLAKLCPLGFVYSFEPDRENIARLEKNISLNNVTNIEVFDKALGAIPGRA